MQPFEGILIMLDLPNEQLATEVFFFGVKRTAVMAIPAKYVYRYALLSQKLQKPTIEANLGKKVYFPDGFNGDGNFLDVVVVFVGEIEGILLAIEAARSGEVKGFWHGQAQQRSL